MPPGYMPPQQQQQKKRWPYVLLGLVGGVVLIIVALSVCFGVALKKGVEKAEEVGLINTETRHARIGEPVKCGNNLELVVYGTKEYTDPSGFSTPKEGFYFLVLELSLENKGKEKEAFSSLMESSVKDKDGFSYDITYVSVEPSLKEGDIMPGEKSRGFIAYQVKKGAEGLRLEVDPLLGDTAIVELGR